MTERLTFQFWSAFRGSVVFEITPSLSADDTARYAISTALTCMNNIWPGTQRRELLCIGVHDARGNLRMMKDILDDAC